jgi:hypothetical protein
MSPPIIPGFGTTDLTAGGMGLGGGNTPLPDPADDPTKNEYYAQRLQTPPWITAGFPDYASYAANLRLKEEQARALSQKQLDTNAGANSATVTATGISTAGANQRAAAQAEIDKAKNAADAAHNAALLALEQGKSDEARRQFDISSQELQRYHTLDIGLRQQDQQLSTAKFGNDVYNKLADLASNPRNYMEQFFRQRGQPVPAGSAAYGNTSVTGPGLATFEQFLPQFLRSTGLAGGGYGYGGPPQGAMGAQTTPTTQPAAKSIPVGPGGSISDWAVKNGYSADTSAQTMNGQKTTADQANINGVPTWAGGAYSGRAVADSPANSGDLTPYLQNPKLADPTGRVPQQFAKGGSLTMTAPHAIVNLLSGKVAAIAGEQRGKGPQGYVPETAKFDGKAIIEPKDGVPPVNPDPTTPTPPPDPWTVTASDPTLKIPGVGTYTGSLINPDPYAGAFTASPAAGSPIPVPTATTATGTGGGTTSNLTSGTTGTTAPQTTTTTTPPPFQLSAAQQAQLDAANALQNAQNTAQRQAQAQAQAAAQAQAQAQAQSQAQAAAAAEAARVASLPSGITPGPVTNDAPNPGPAPAPVVTPTNIPNPSSSFDNLLNTPSGIGKNPSFLPEDQAALDPILQQMLQSGTFPPFLQRIFAQQKGLAGLGTNVPQATDLPPGVPLVSKLAYSQMSPNERSAFESYLSAHGLDLAEYLSMVEAASPQGGTSPVNPAIPKFLQQ